MEETPIQRRDVMVVTGSGVQYSVASSWLKTPLPRDKDVGMGGRGSAERWCCEIVLSCGISVLHERSIPQQQLTARNISVSWQVAMIHRHSMGTGMRHRELRCPSLFLGTRPPVYHQVAETGQSFVRPWVKNSRTIV